MSTDQATLISHTIFCITYKNLFSPKSWNYETSILQNGKIYILYHLVIQMMLGAFPVVILGEDKS